MLKLATGLLIACLTTGTALAQGQKAGAFLIAELDVKDQTALTDYAAKTTELVAKYGGTFVARRSKIVNVIGEAPKTVSVIEFASLEKAQAYTDSADYKALSPLRDTAAKFRIYIVEASNAMVK